MDLEAPSHDDKNISQDETANSVQVLAKDMPYEPPTYSKTSPGKRKNLFLAILALVIIAALVVGLSVGLTNKNDEDTKRGSALDEDTEDSAGAVSTPTLAPSVSQGPTAEPKRFPDVVNFLVQQGISSETDLMTDGTPQNRAARWIADEDLHLASFGDDDYQVGVINQAFQFVARYALAVFAFSTNGPNGWTQPLYFLSGRPVCGWYDTNFLGQRVGVSCDDQWLRPERLVMDYVGLRGPIPAELAKIWTIRTIDMENNFLNGTLPEGLGNLPLTFFVLKGNSISGPLPSNLGQNGLMEVMVMSNNQMTGPIPTSLSMSTNLRSLGLLYVDRNSLTGSLEALCTLDNFKLSAETQDQIGADCVTEVNCTCCTFCCTDGTDEGCHDNTFVPSSDPFYENNYDRPGFFFGNTSTLVAP